ncbi:uncharacterized protein LOC123516285 isoform X2 [Portunus trituberculatus]|uniref:uncharacterized protein LOC123516285 isoform X2 n=1 Tax=Portunus trituberculatus TaxID=210409 RepID=UPI001E1CE323|nr:uncharacterized protein LOC123516285 isoform X2 [Portunus trituberculatus]
MRELWLLFLFHERHANKGEVETHRETRQTQVQQFIGAVTITDYADLKTSEDMKSEIDNTLTELRRYIGERIIPNDSDLLGIYGRTLVNCFSLVDKSLLSIGCAVYLAASIFDNNCTPNCFVTFSGFKVEVRSLIDMPDLDLAKCYISYTDVVSTSAARRELLYKGWFFLCECKTCLDEERAKYENSIKCETLNCQGIVSLPEASDTVQQIKLKIKAAREREEKRREKEKEKELEGRRKWRKEERNKYSGDEGKVKMYDTEVNGEEGNKVEAPRCGLCGWIPSSEKLKQYWNTVAFMKKQLKNMDQNNLNIEHCLQTLEKQTSFTSRNAWKVKILDLSFNAAILNNCWSLALKYGEENLDGMRFYYSDNSPVFSLFLFNLGKAKIYLKEFREGLHLLEEAELSLKTGLGTSHPIVEELHQLTLLANEDREICLERWSTATKKQDEKQQLHQIHSSGDEALAKIFATLNQISRSSPQNLSGV